MRYFISGDWGTSRCRFRLVDTGSFEVVGRKEDLPGTAAAFGQWKADSPIQEREGFYLDLLRAAADELLAQAGLSSSPLSLILSGMASSSLGLCELPYARLPQPLSGETVITHWIRRPEIFPLPVLLISGMRSEQDMMRGEETMIIGAAQMAAAPEELMLLPGTHSKHAMIRNGQIEGVRTYMTGEFFDLLATKSILSHSLTPAAANEPDDEFFLSGVRRGIRGNLLHEAFGIRTNDLLNGRSREANAQYLSGLLIGSELGALRETGMPCRLIAEGKLARRYAAALRELGIPFQATKAETALLRGQWTIYQQHHKPTA